MSAPEKKFSADIPLVFSVNDNYAKYLSVCIRSIQRYRNSELRYHIFIMHRDISEEHQSMILEMADAGTQISFINVSGQLDSSILYISGTITEETYYRVLIPELLPELDKVVYLDCDLVCTENIAGLYEAADFSSGDMWFAGTLASRNELRDSYTREHLGVPSDTYINAGVMVINCAALRENHFLEQAVAFLKEKQYLKWHDQDLVNALGYSHILLLDRRWHATLGTIANELGVPVNDLKLNDLNYAIVHFASRKPWRSELLEPMTLFWQYVPESPFVSDIIREYSFISDTKRRYEDLCSSNQVSLKEIVICLNRALSSRFRNLKNR